MSDDTTINGHSAYDSNPIKLKLYPATPRDLRAASGIILSVLMGGNVLLWGYIVARFFA